MSQRQFNEDELAAYLDQHLPPGSMQNSIPDSETDPLVQAAARLSNAPQPIASADARARMQATMFDAMPDTSAQSPPDMMPARVIRFPPALLAAVAAVAIFIIGIALVTQTGEDDNAVAILSTETATATATEIATESATIAVDTPVPTNVESTAVTVITNAPVQIQPTEIVPTDVPTTQVQPTRVVPSATNTFTPTVTDTNTPRPTSTPTTQAAIIIEGEVEAIDRNIITIYGFKIQLDEDDPLLKLLNVEDFIRVEGDFISSGGEFIVTATLVDMFITINTGSNTAGGTSTVDVIINNAEGEVWRDNGGCNNPPPSWAPANGWRRRCEGNGNSNQGRGRGN